MADDMITARVHPSVKKKLQASGYNARQAIEYFVKDYYSANPRKRMEVKRQILENDLENLKKQECEIQVEIEHTENMIKELSVGNVGDVPVVPVVPVEKEVVNLSAEMEEGLRIIQNAVDNKKDLELSSNLSNEKNLDTFFKKHYKFLTHIFDNHFSELSFKEFKDLVYSEIVV